MTEPLDSRAGAITAAIAVILLSSFLVVGAVMGSASPATSVITKRESRNTLNISRGQYEAALAKWNDLHVTEYEAVVQVSGWGKWKIVVHVDPAYGSTFAPGVQATYSHRVVHFEALDSEAAKLDEHLYRYITIGGLFDNVEDDLHCQENSCEDRHYFLPTRYLIEFDQTMGYPRSITSINEYATVETRIEDVKILK